MELVREYRFEAARRLPRLGDDHPCGRVHGHSFVVEVGVEGPVDPVLGWVMDFGDIDAVVTPAVNELDHRYLNDVSGLDNPTSERIAMWLWERAAPALPGLTFVSVAETPTSRCIYRGARR